jgi:hypothetical protein
MQQFDSFAKMCGWRPPERWARRDVERDEIAAGPVQQAQGRQPLPQLSSNEVGGNVPAEVQSPFGLKKDLGYLQRIFQPTGIGVHFGQVFCALKFSPFSARIMTEFTDLLTGHKPITNNE